MSSKTGFINLAFNFPKGGNYALDKAFVEDSVRTHFPKEEYARVVHNENIPDNQVIYRFALPIFPMPDHMRDFFGKIRAILLENKDFYPHATEVTLEEAKMERKQ